MKSEERTMRLSIGPLVFLLVGAGSAAEPVAEPVLPSQVGKPPAQEKNVGDWTEGDWLVVAKRRITMPTSGRHRPSARWAPR